jgi:hypothetical protein
MTNLNRCAIAAVVLGTVLSGAPAVRAQVEGDAPNRPPEQITPNPLRPELYWNIAWPDPSLPAAGYPILAGVEHFEVYHGNREEGVYSHHAQITYHNGRFFAAWSNHGAADEDGPGQRVLLAVSSDGRTWSPFVELFPPIDKNEPSGNRPHGSWRCLTANGWVVQDGQLYAIAEVFDGGEKFRGFGRVARRVTAAGPSGSVFWLSDNPPEPLPGFPRYSDLTDPAFTKTAAAIARILTDPLETLPWEYQKGTCWANGLDGQPICEPTVYSRPDGALVKVWRDKGHAKSLRLYASVSTRRGFWWPAIQTNAPSAPSKVVSGSLPGGVIYLVGNFVPGSRDPLGIAVSTDGRNFNRAAAIRQGAPPPRFSTRAPAFAYPSAVVADNALWVIYSIGKEDIAVSRVPLASLTALVN